MRFIVEYGYRTDSGKVSPLSTHKDAVEVDAETEQDARTKAIEAAYRKGACSHVTILATHPSYFNDRESTQERMRREFGSGALGARGRQTQEPR